MSAPRQSCTELGRPGESRRSASPIRALLTLGGLLCLLSLTAAAGPLHAHNVGESYLYLQVYPERLSGRFEIPLSDLNTALGLSGTPGEITEENLEAKIGFLQDYYLDHVEFAVGQQPLTIVFTAFEFLPAHDGYALMSFDLEGFDEVPEVLTVDYSVLFDDEPSHRGYLLIEHNWATGTFANENQITLVFDSGSRRQQLDLTSSGLLRGFLAVLRLGFDHLVLGFDHAIFLVALLLPAVLRRENGGAWQPVDSFADALRQVVPVVLAFMIGHSLTLWLSALGLLELPERLVEVVIAASIGLLAVNLLWPLFERRILVIVFVLALFHGAGFAAAISGLGVLGEKLGLSLFAFNLGIELGVAAIAVVLLPLFFLMRRTSLYRRFLLPAAAVAMIAISCVWVVERLFGLDFRLTRRVRSLLRGGAS